MPEMENVEIDIEDDVFFAIAMEAHKRDITFNKMVEIILKEKIEKEESKLLQKK
jgi:hypothetical protein